ncbi:MULTISPECIES: DUF2459 domain-containing protein [Methylobacterium]|uniref:DUF2459 domain-containing protein n=1 Tax=Methylobacterium jeotgali TaxID=381630 RepID=A0ABQ4STD4_9HYPH|nr:MULTISPECIES: DUF2459 domain-containing protein [Methylobacterium]PIU07656.1 MAG: DUF2459 domain-containing protein [Methylobacterium sp. CG09_land_8_20_14_0_10_71_15]PIU11344.1 MAG: DUF2459 domain-containing protein [Methylobacterium sp. CG08_land_8_20_14_0_20_71_15]GBU20096.1 hypothetical protein AwMethylo_43110 [Methylobacterium sp.]GJE05749.1 hypothetical protein AOPFMNJM_1055 [Methylobacterium jeotgali]
MRLRRLAGIAAALLVILVLAVVTTALPRDPGLFPAPPAEAVTIHLVSHGWHSGLVLPRAALEGEGAGAALRSVAVRFRAYERLEFGWGEARFYRATPTLREVDWGLALAALFTPGGREGVVQVVGLPEDVRGAFPAAEIVPVPVSKAGLARLLARLERAFRLADGQPVAEGPGLYGPSLFYAGAGRFSYRNLCNHWAARLLNAAGVPVAPIPASHPAGLIRDLAWRSGLHPLPPSGGG